MLDLDLLLRDVTTGHEVRREPLPAHVAERLIADTHVSGVLAGVLPNDGAAIRVDRFTLETDDGPARLRVEVGAGAHGTEGSETHLRITPEALAAVGARETDARRAGGLAHSHPFGPKLEPGADPRFLSSEDKAVATGWFWQPHHIQLIVDPRF